MRVPMRMGPCFHLTMALAMLFVSSAQAQSVWLPPDGGSQIHLEVLKADYTFDGVSASSRVYYLGGQAHVSPTISLVFELPISHYDEGLVEIPFSFPPQYVDFDPETKIGNPYIGLISRPERSSFVGEGGIRLPATNDEDANAAINGWYTDFDRWEAFIPDLITFRVRGGQDMTQSSESMNIYSRWRLGGTFWIPTQQGADGEAFVDATAALWFEPGGFLLGGTLVGRTLLTAQGASFGERSEFSVGFGAHAWIGPVRPGLHVHVPLSNDGLIGVGDAVDVVYGISVSYRFPEKTRTRQPRGFPPGF